MIKDHSTAFRNKNIFEHPEFTSLEQWGSYSLVPLDIPKFERPDIVSWFFENCKPAKKTKAEHRGMGDGRLGEVFWETVDVSPTLTISEYGDVWTTNYHQEFLSLFPDFMEQVNEYFPFISLERMRFWSTVRNIAFHQEPAILADFPSVFRIVLSDPGPDKLFLRDLNRQSHPLPRLEDTNSYAWNNLRMQNGSTFNSGSRELVILLNKYELDVDRYNSLMHRSIEKYSASLITDTNPITDYVDL